VATDNDNNAKAIAGHGGPAGGGGGVSARGSVPASSGDGGNGVIFFKKL